MDHDLEWQNQWLEDSKRWKDQLEKEEREYQEWKANEEARIAEEKRVADEAKIHTLEDEQATLASLNAARDTAIAANSAYTQTTVDGYDANEKFRLEDAEKAAKKAANQQAEAVAAIEKLVREKAAREAAADAALMEQKGEAEAAEGDIRQRYIEVLINWTMIQLEENVSADVIGEMREGFN